MLKEVIIDENTKGLRLDKALATLTDLSRTVIKSNEDSILVNGKKEKLSFKVSLDDKISIEVKENEELDLKPIDMNLDIVYEDEDIAVINKPKGIVVHPSIGHHNDTLVSGLLYELDNLSQINGVIRPGIVHRIDKDTSGLIIVAKNDVSHNKLVDQLKDHTLFRVYNAICCGVINEDKGRINAPIGRDPKDRKKQAVIKDGKEAITHFKVLERFKAHTLVECRLETGRTHQIRVHMSYIGKPILGDPMYGPRKIYGDIGQYLHAKKIGFIHPRTNEYMEFETELPEYFKVELNKLREE